MIATTTSVLRTLSDKGKQLTMKRMAITGGMAALALALAGCSAPEAGGDPVPENGQPVTTETGERATTEFLAEHDLAGMGAVEVIDRLDRLPVSQRPENLMASVRNEELVLTDGTQEVAMDLPEDRSYVSIAPFVEETHDCFFHSLTTCLGEMSEEPVEVTITDAATEEAVVDESTTFDNGFIGFWLPFDISGTIEVSAAGKTGSTEFSSSDDSATCVTDLQLR
jgi:hypothetical protein